MENHMNIKKNIVALLSMFPSIKGNRNEIVSYYWVIYDNVTTPDQIAKATPAESILRNVRRLAETRHIELPPTTTVEKKERIFTHEFNSL